MMRLLSLGPRIRILPIPTVLQMMIIIQRRTISILYLTKDVEAPKWLKTLPDEIVINELTLDRVSLHEIFIDIATDKNLLKDSERQSLEEVGGTNA